MHRSWSDTRNGKFAQITVRYRKRDICADHGPIPDIVSGKNRDTSLRGTKPAAGKIKKVLDMPGTS